MSIAVVSWPIVRGGNMRAKCLRWLVGVSLLPISGFVLAGFDDLVIQTDVHGDYVLGVIAHDQRDYVMKGDTPEDVWGRYIKGIFRTRAEVKTDSGTPVAAEVAEGLRKALIKSKWLSAAVIGVSSKDTREDVLSLVKTAKLRRCVVVTINDLWTESYKNTSVNYKFTILVLDDKAQQLAQAESTGVHDTREWGGDAAAEIFGRVMTETLAKPEFSAALRN
jgi:hypothetical protein